MDEMTVEPVDSTAGLARWFLVAGDRRLVSLVVLIGVGVTFFLVGILGIATVTTPPRVMWYLNGTVNGLLTLVPIAVGVNQIVLSHEFGSIEDLYKRRDDITDFRERVEARTDVSVSSPYASTFFGTLLSAISDAGRAVRRECDRPGGDPTTDELASVAGSVAEEADRANEALSSEETTMLRTLLVVLSYRDSRQFYEIRRLQRELSDSEPETSDELQRMEELFVELDAARQFLKTVVVERQLARLSRLLVYTGIPAVAIAAIGIFSYRNLVGLPVAHPLLLGIVGTILVVTLAPLAILSAYILRVATIARQTAMYGPFIPEADD